MIALFVILLVLGTFSSLAGTNNGRVNPNNIIMVQTLTRHGTRSPDKAVAQHTCRPLIDPTHGGVRRAFVEVFGVGPAELTNVGVQQMRDVGAFLRERYHGFVWADYAAHSKDWEFLAREGSRQQRSMMGITQGLFQDEAVPIMVTRRETDSILGGPAPACAKNTAAYILEWQRTKGREVVRKNYDLVQPFERVCNISLIQNPVVDNGGANPHAYIGDISDLFDSLKEANREPLPVSEIVHDRLTDLAFYLEQHAHFDFPGGAAMHVGDFMEHILSSFETVEANGGKREDQPKMRLHTCSRELHYGLVNMFGWQDALTIPDQPKGRIRAGTTFIWELRADMTVRTYYYQFPGMNPHQLQPAISLKEYRKKYQAAIAQYGDWKKLCLPPGESLDQAIDSELRDKKEKYEEKEIPSLDQVKPKKEQVPGSDEEKDEDKDDANEIPLIDQDKPKKDDGVVVVKDGDAVKRAVEDDEEYTEEDSVPALSTAASPVSSDKKKLLQTPDSKPSSSTREEEFSSWFSPGWMAILVATLFALLALYFTRGRRTGYTTLN